MDVFRSHRSSWPHKPSLPDWFSYSVFSLVPYYNLPGFRVDKRQKYFIFFLTKLDGFVGVGQVFSVLATHTLGLCVFANEVEIFEIARVREALSWWRISLLLSLQRCLGGGLVFCSLFSVVLVED